MREEFTKQIVVCARLPGEISVYLKGQTASQKFASASWVLLSWAMIWCRRQGHTVGRTWEKITTELDSIFVLTSNLPCSCHCSDSQSPFFYLVHKDSPSPWQKLCWGRCTESSLVYKKGRKRSGMASYTCNPNYPGGRDQEAHGSKLVQAKS
jgi:hypothetical protein